MRVGFELAGSRALEFLHRISKIRLEFAGANVHFFFKDVLHIHALRLCLGKTEANFTAAASRGSCNLSAC